MLRKMLSILLIPFAIGWDYNTADTWFLNYPDCGGESQSPIDLGVSYFSKDLEEVKIEYPKGNLPFEVENEGHTIKATPLTPNYILVNSGELFYMKQLHFHSPSEHTLNGLHYSSELHLVHLNQFEDKIIVLTLLFNLGEYDNPYFQEIIYNSPPVKSLNYTIINLDLNKILKKYKKSSYYIYEGSLTTPPCSEIATFIIYKRPIELSQYQVNSLRMKYDESGTNRPVQALNDREVLEYSNKC